MQNTQVSETKEFKSFYSSNRNSKEEFRGVAISVWCYQGELVTPKWKDVDSRKSLILQR